MSQSTGSLLVLSGPSGVGKTTIARKLREVPGIVRVMTTTTRARRPQEEDGRDYRFLSREAFEAAVARGEFLEYAQIDGNLYGTPREAIERELAQGKVVLVDIDPQGARSVRALGLRALFVFVEPPSMDELRARLLGRKSESPDAVTTRLVRAEREMKERSLYDVVVVNDTVDRAVEAILAAARTRGLLS
jgi:guanylate kinase